MTHWLSAAEAIHISRSRRGRLLAGALALAMAATLAPAHSQAVAEAGNGAGAANAASGEPRVAEVTGEVVTLVTGDRVQLQRSADGRIAATVDPAPREGRRPTFETTQDGEDVYVFPSDARRLVPDVLDRELFNVSRLFEYGYTGQVPVITTYRGQATARTHTAPGGADVTSVLPSINATAATVDPDGDWWRRVSEPGAAQRAGVEKVWLDGMSTVALDESGPLIGASEAVAAGYDGTGQTVAVLDTGIDESHPELAGAVVAAENFTDDDSTADEHGHGTHVAGTIAGSGDTYTGIAPGAELLSGKICDSGGSCPDSAVIAGMEWAAPRADIVNMSIGSNAASDGADPTSQAVNALTAQHETLFVVAAGNLGSHGIASPGAADRALTVGAVDKQEQLAGFSSRGPRVGDFAVKPDLTAPGVDIVAPRSGDGTMPPPAEPVSDLHIRASGTSMASPHAAGAAAILRQQAPDLNPTELKAALMGAAVPHDDLTVYQQGAGRADIPAALDAPVRAAPAPLDLGDFTYPHDEQEPVVTELTYTNRTDAPLTLDLSLEVANREGAAPGADMLSIAPETVQIGAGSSATVDVTLDVREGDHGVYGGYVVADRDGQPVHRTPLGFRKEDESYVLTVEGIDRDGRPARGTSSLDVFNMHDATIREIDLDFIDGAATLRVPPGRYAALGMITLYPRSSNFPKGKAFVAETGFEVTEDTTVTLDARGTDPITVDTPAHESAEPIGTMRFAYRLLGEDTGSYVHTWTGQGLPYYSRAIPEVATGDIEFYHRWRLGEPRLALSVTEPVTQKLSPRLMAGDTPRVDGDFALPVVDVGHGAPEDYVDVDVEGALVLARRGGPNHAAKEAAARAAGAKALVVANDREGNYAGWVGNDVEIPAMTVSQREGDDLLALLDEGDVTVRLYGEPATPYLYDVVFREPDGLPGDLTYEVEPSELVAVENRFHGAVPGHELGEGRHLWAPWETISISLVEDIFAGQERVEYFTPGNMRYQQYAVAAQPFDGKMEEEVVTYPERDTWRRNWFAGPLRPGTIGGVGTGRGQVGEPTYREGDELAVRIEEWVDADGHWGSRDSSTDTSRFRLYRDGELLGEADRPQVDVVVDPTWAEYRLELDAARDTPWWPTSTSTRTAWTVGSQRTADGEREVLPLLQVDYDIPLDMHHVGPHPREHRGPPRMDLYVTHQHGADAPAIAGARMWVSYDDGQRWMPRPVRSRGDGHYEAILPMRSVPAESEFASVRVEAWDQDGNRIEQEITRAWRLPSGQAG